MAVKDLKELPSNTSHQFLRRLLADARSAFRSGKALHLQLEWVYAYPKWAAK